MALQKGGERQGSVHSHKITLRHLMLLTQYFFFYSFTHILPSTQLLRRLLCSVNGIIECNISHRLTPLRATAVDSRHIVKCTGVKCDKIVAF